MKNAIVLLLKAYLYYFKEYDSKIMGTTIELIVCFHSEQKTNLVHKKL